MNLEEEVDKEVSALDALTDTVAQLVITVQTQNDVLLVLANKLNIDTDIPDWKDKKEIEKEVGPKIQACINMMRKIYGPSETDKG